MWRNDIKCKYMLMFSLKNSARKGLSNQHLYICVPLRTTSHIHNMQSHGLEINKHWSDNWYVSSIIVWLNTSNTWQEWGEWFHEYITRLLVPIKDICMATSTQYLRLTGDYRKVSNIRRTLVGNKIVDRSDVVGASPVGAAPTTSSFST